jgi:hypothetical protein
VDSVCFSSPVFIKYRNPSAIRKSRPRSGRARTSCKRSRANPSSWGKAVNCIGLSGAPNPVKSRRSGARLSGYQAHGHRRNAIPIEVSRALNSYNFIKPLTRQEPSELWILCFSPPSSSSNTEIRRPRRNQSRDPGVCSAFPERRPKRFQVNGRVEGAIT